MLRQMLVAVDISECGRHAAQYALNMSRAIGGTVTLLHVLEDQESTPADLEAAQALLQELSLLARRPPNCLILPAGGEARVASVILGVAEHLNAELIVIGLYGQEHQTVRMLGQVTHQVLLDAHIPVQVVSYSSNRTTPDR